MKNCIALKPCRFQGKNYKIGDKISEEIVGKKSVGSLLAMKFLIEDNSPPEKKPKKKLKVGDDYDLQL